ncbi:MAG TPA: methyltransferase domain-containing protein [Candidatus Nitrosopolaris sp.]|nr:methyltransferase domain-containing protein [Candidatus Nitrosopolaris sp.]
MVTIAGYGAECHRVDVAGQHVDLWRVADLERHVDRTALLGAEDPPEPPYWAHLWSGALVLAAAIPEGARSVIELGCGLGLPGLVAACRGARVTFVDRVSAALAFTRASARLNRVTGVDFVAADCTTPALAARFDLVLAAELLYDRRAFPGIARALARLLAAGGRALLTDARRIDTGEFYEVLETAGLTWQATDHPVREEGLPLTIRLIEITARGEPPPDRGGGAGGATDERGPGESPSRRNPRTSQRRA